MKTWEWSNKLKKLPPYLFAEIDRQKSELREEGISFIDLSIGDPDIPAPDSVIQTLHKSAKQKENQKYALDQGKLGLRKAIAVWFQGRFGVTLDENKQILPLIGSKEGLVHFPLGVINPGDYVIVPSPGYPGYRGAAVFSGAKIHELPLLEKNNFLPNLDSIPRAVCNKAKIIYVNYPNNPTTVVAPVAFLAKLVKFCAKYGIILVYDNAYSEMFYEQKPVSILEIKGADEVAIEFHSFSKTFCMTGFRVGWACGNESLVKILLKVKTNFDSGVFGAIQEAGETALLDWRYAEKVRTILRERRDVFIYGLKKIGFHDIYADSTFYVWTKIPRQYKSSIDFAAHLIQKKRIIATPGVGFGRYGEGFIRFALTVDTKVLKRALDILSVQK